MKVTNLNPLPGMCGVEGTDISIRLEPQAKAEMYLHQEVGSISQGDEKIGTICIGLAGGPLLFTFENPDGDRYRYKISVMDLFAKVHEHHLAGLEAFLAQAKEDGVT